VSSSNGIAVRFGDPVLQAGFTAIPNLVLNHYAALDISPVEMMFTIHVFQHWWSEKLPFPSLQAISQKMGVERRQARRYVQSLKEKGYLVVSERTLPGLGKVASEYDFSPLIQAVLSRAVEEQEDTHRSEMSYGGRSNLTDGHRSEMSPEEYEDQEDSVQEDEAYISKGKAMVIDHVTQSQPPSAPVGNGVQTRITRAQAPQGPAFNVPPTIAHYVKAWSHELHDSEHVKSNITQAFRLMQQAGMSETVFMQKMTEARAITKERGNIKKPADEFGTKNKVPYWFAVLKDLLGMKPQPEQENRYQYKT